MKNAYLSTAGSAVALTLAALSAGHDLAADPAAPKTRAQILKE